MKADLKEVFPQFTFRIDEPFNDFSQFIGDDPAKRAELDKWRASLRAKLDLSEYRHAGRQWYQKAWQEVFAFMYDTSFYDRHAGRYRIEEYLDDGLREFGGYDVLLLWQSYPRLGIDSRNQFDIYRDMPGGLPGLKDLVDRAHARGVRVFVNYNPWDTATRRPAGSDGEELAEIVSAIGADGVFLDTMETLPPEFKAALEKANPNFVFEPEGQPATSDLQTITGAWLQGPTIRAANEIPPFLPTIRWLEPRFSYRGIVRTATTMTEHLTTYFFNGCGQVIWENIFGWWNPWPAKDRALWRRCLRILRAHAEAFNDPNWQPLIGTLIENVHAHRWQAGRKTVYTLLNMASTPHDDFVLKVPHEDGMKYYDMWNDQTIEPAIQSGEAFLRVKMAPQGGGCIIALPAGEPSPLLPSEPPSMNNGFRKRITLAAVQPRSVAATAPARADALPGGMCLVPGGRFCMHVRHNSSPWVEGACYGSVEHHQDKRHPSQYFWLSPYAIDRTEVTNQQYLEFLQAAQYCPADLTNFLKLWGRPAGAERQPWKWQMPEGKSNHPVVYVDLDDARAYARWAGKRLPREEEWQYAAEGPDGRFWPWAHAQDVREELIEHSQYPIPPGQSNSWQNNADPKFCNTRSGDTTPVDRYPQGASPFGCLDMAGNVWEWTESERDDGHTRYAIIRGGSYLFVPGSVWYNASGAQPNACHEKMLLMYPGLDRCETIGFRCVKDVEM